MGCKESPITPSAPGQWTLEKQPQRSPEALLVHTKISGLGAHNWNSGWAGTLISVPAACMPDPKCPNGRIPQSVACGHTDKKHLGGRAHLKPGVGAQQDQWLAAPPSRPPSTHRPKAVDLQHNPGPKPRSALQRDHDQRPGCLQMTTPKSTSSEKLLHCPCAKSPAELTSSLGGRQNAQQRGGAGLGETAFPGRIRPGRGLNHPIAASRAPSI